MKDLLKNKFTPDGKKSFNYQEYLKNEKKKKDFTSHKVRFLAIKTGIQDSFKNTLPLDGKIKLAVVGLSKNGRKNGFH